MMNEYVEFLNSYFQEVATSNGLSPSVEENQFRILAKMIKDIGSTFYSIYEPPVYKLGWIKKIHSSRAAKDEKYPELTDLEAETVARDGIALLRQAVIAKNKSPDERSVTISASGIIIVIYLNSFC